MTVSAEFLNTAIAALGDVNSYLDPVRQADIRQVRYFAQYEPTSWQLESTGTESHQILLGLYASEPKPTIIIFESSLRRLASRVGDLYSVVKDTLDHEINQHYFGLNHSVKEAT